MRKKSILKIIVMLICVFVIKNMDIVYAETCSTTELNNLKQLASNIKFTYGLYDDTYNDIHTYYFDIFVTNFSQEFYFKDMDGHDFKYIESLEEDGVRRLRTVKEGIRYSIGIYTSNITKCPDTLIVTKKIELPYYNDYSQREECEGIEEFSLCQKYYGGYIPSEEYFLKQITKYKNGEINDDGNEKLNLIEYIVNFFTNNLLIVIPVTSILAVALVLIIRKYVKRKKRIKIKI